MYTRKRPRTAAVATVTPYIIDDEDNDHEAQVQPDASNAEVGMEVEETRMLDVYYIPYIYDIQSCYMLDDYMDD
jgi:hypothetical protein